MERIWTFKTARFTVALDFLPEDDLDLSFDETGETADKLDSGHLIAFVAHVTVSLNGVEIAADALGGCIYESAEDFAGSHRDPDPMNRNCSIMRADRGNVMICHYFPDMVREAIAEARKHLSDLPAMREVAA